MAANLSNEFALDLTLNDLISEAYELLQTIGDGETITGGLFNRGRRSLNIMLKLWETQGIHLWTQTEGSMFLDIGRQQYDFRNEGFEGLAADPDAIHLTNAPFTQTSITADVLAGVGAVTLTDATDVVLGGQIGFLNDANELDWYIVMELVGSVVTLSRVLDNDISAGTIVYAYTYFQTTTLDAPYAAGVTLSVADTSIFTVGNSIYVHTTANVTDERIVASIDEGAGTIDVTVALSGAAGAGEVIANITTRRSDFFRPVKRIPDTPAAVRRRESTDYEIPIVFQSRDDYFELPNKNQNGTPIQAYYSRQQPQGIMYIWNPASSGRSVINFTYEREIMVMTDPDHTFDLPVDWFDAIAYNLAKRLIPKVGCSAERKVIINEGAKEFLDNALGFDQAVYPIRLVPQKYG